MAKKHEKPENCLNCGEKLTGKYCPECGQKNTGFHESIWHLVAEALEEAFSFDSKLYRSVYLLLLRPGLLTREYNEGKRARYIRPFRIYLFCSILYFFVMSFYGPFLFFGDSIKEQPGEGEEIALGVTDSTTVVVTDSRSVLEKPEPQNTIILFPFSDVVTESVVNDITDSATHYKVLNMDFEELDSIIEGWRSAEEDTGIYIMGSTYFYSMAKDYLIDQYERLKAMSEEDLESSFLDRFEKNLPTMLFFLLPVVALILKLIYPLSRRYYIGHLVFSLHIHSFVFLFMMLLLITGNNSFIVEIAPFVLLLYLFIAMRTAYFQSYLGTLAKLFLLLVLYSMALGTTFVLTVLLTLVFL